MDEDKKLEDKIKGGLGGTERPFDFEAFKQRYPDQVSLYQAQVQRKRNQPFRLRLQLGRCVKLAVAALVLVTVGISLMNMDQTEVKAPPPRHEPAPSTMSVFALNRAYRAGGLDAIDEQYEKAFAKLGPRTSSMALSNVLNERL